MKNFAFPYFSRDIAEFWRRWHISLSTWFRDYLYIPLGGSRGGTLMKVRNTFIIFIVSGFWHGANWTFIVWGALNAIYFLPLLLRNKNRVHTGGIAENRVLPTFKELRGMLLTFALTVLAWVFFRAEDMAHAGQFLIDLFLGLDDYMNYYKTYRLLYNFSPALVMILVIFILIEWRGRHDNFAIVNFFNQNRFFRYLGYLIISFLIFLYSGQQQEFIYFQF
jgi:D-alanyl-lipoteichoic acid acyltransferase DltB (MBOAT superfamily)